MGSSWRYCHVAITPYSIGGFHGLPCTFFTGLLVLFHWLAFRFDGQGNVHKGLPIFLRFLEIPTYLCPIHYVLSTMYYLLCTMSDFP